MSTTAKIIDNQFTLQQMAFIKAYTAKGTDTFYNGTLSYAEAYEYDLPIDEKTGKIIVDCREYNTCKSNASRLMRDDTLRTHIRDKMLEYLNDKDVDERLNEIMHKGTEANSIAAIKIANDLKNRITKKIDVTSAGRPLLNLTDSELEALAQ